MRNINKALTVVSLLAPVSGYSLGIGDIRVRSALNQNLDAEIVLVTSKGENPSSIKVNLAPSEKFDEAGVPWTYFLSKIRFQTIVKPNGAVVVKLTSREALKEPYLNFLLEVTWPKGSLYREFTVLVDPPSDYQQQSYQEPAYVAPSRFEPYSQQPEFTTQPVRRSARPRSSSSASFGGQVLTRKNDTLWKVASHVRGSGVSVEQMMMSLYENNPHAFYQQNVNALSAGKTLKIPDKNTVQQLSRQEALDEFSKHNAAWNTNRSGVPSGLAQTENEEAAERQLKLEAPTDGAVAAKENVTPSSEQSSGDKEAGSQSTSQQLPTAEKESTKPPSSSAADEALQSKIAALEKQMAMMQELIALKDKQLAELQNPAQSTVAPAPESQPKAPTKPEPEVGVPSAQVKPEPQSTPVAPTQALPTAPKPIAPTKPVVKQPVKKPPQPTPVPAAEESSPLPWVLGGLGAILLPLFGWLWWQKKKIIQETEAESMFRNYSTMRNNETSGPLSTITRKAATSPVSGESSFLNDFKASDFESFETFNVDHDDIDPIEEADVYLAYGRYQQAEDLIRQAIAGSPERDECKLKLLEIFHASSNKQDFENYAMELAAAGKQEDKEFWRKATELSKDICPDSPLFTQPIPSTTAVFPDEPEVLAESILLVPSVTEDAAATKEAENVDHQGAATFEVLSDQTSEATFEVNGSSIHDDNQKPTPETTENKAGSAPSFDLDSFEDSFAGVQDNESLDFDLGPYPGPSQKPMSDDASIDFSGTTNIGADEQKGQIDALDEKDEIETLEFDFNFDKKEAPGSKNAPNEIKSIDNWDPGQTLDFSFDTPVDDGVAEDNTIDLSFDLEPSLSTPSKAGFDEEGFNLSDLTDMDELETKLDLAKAYIDMGDIESAKDILGQVLEKGSSEQKKAAMALLDELSLG